MDTTEIVDAVAEPIAETNFKVVVTALAATAVIAAGVVAAKKFWDRRKNDSHVLAAVETDPEL
jgi:hypothetical protein